jgi:hypothetical protein
MEADAGNTKDYYIVHEVCTNPSFFLALLAFCAPLVVREIRYSGDLRVCSRNSFFNFYFDELKMSYDDGAAEDQFWEITPCDRSVRNCFISYVSYISQQDEKISQTFFKNTKIFYTSDGELDRLVPYNSRSKMYFEKCNFPLFR